MQPPGGVHKHHVALPGLGGAHSVKDYGGGVGPLVLLDDIHPSPVGPDGQLLGGGGPEGIRGAEEDLLSLLSELMADLADGGSLTHPIHSNKQYHRGGGGQVQSRTPGVHGLSDDLDHGGAGLLHGLNPLLPHPAAQRLHQFQGHVHPSIGQDEGLLQLVVEVVRQLRAETGKNVDFFQFIKKAHGQFVPFLKQLVILFSAEGALAAVQVIAASAPGTFYLGYGLSGHPLVPVLFSPVKF